MATMFVLNFNRHKPRTIDQATQTARKGLMTRSAV